jgi:hypothetical protein
VLSVLGLCEPAFSPEDDGDAEASCLGIASPEIILPIGSGMDSYVRIKHIGPVAFEQAWWVEPMQ